MYAGHEVSSGGRLARRKTGHLLVVFNCLLVAGWKFSSHPPKRLQGCGVAFVVLFFVCCLYIFFGVLRLRVGSTISVYMGSRLDGASRGGGGMSRGDHGYCCPPPPSAPPFLEGSSLRPTKPKPRCRIKGRNTYFEEGHWDGSSYGCVGFLAFECVAAWECSAAQLRISLTW